MATATSFHTENYSDDVIVRRNVKRDLYCKLTDEEQLRIAKTRATKEAECDELSDDLARETKKRKEQIGELEDQIAKMGRELRTGEQERTIPCDEVFRIIDGAGWIAVIRKDTLAEVERRPATAHESQRYLPGIDGPGSGGALDIARSAQAAETKSEAKPDTKDVPEGDDEDIDAADDNADMPDDEDDEDESDDSDPTVCGAVNKKMGAPCHLAADHDGFHANGKNTWKAGKPKKASK